MTDTSAAPGPKTSRLTTLLRLAELLAAALLVGGLAASFAIGNFAFSSASPLTREQAGRFMARVFEASPYVEGGALAIVVAARAARGYVRRAVAMLPFAAGAVGGHLYLTLEMRAIRLAHGGSIADLAPGDPERSRFMSLHGFYFLGALLILAYGIALLLEHARRREV